MYLRNSSTSITDTDTDIASEWYFISDTAMDAVVGIGSKTDMIHANTVVDKVTCNTEPNTSILIYANLI
jgi:hypothetical protein